MSSWWKHISLLATYTFRDYPLHAGRGRHVVWPKRIIEFVGTVQQMAEKGCDIGFGDTAVALRERFSSMVRVFKYHIGDTVIFHWNLPRAFPRFAAIHYMRSGT